MGMGMGMGMGMPRGQEKSSGHLHGAAAADAGGRAAPPCAGGASFLRTADHIN